MAVVQYTFTHKQYIEQQNETEYMEQNIFNNNRGADNSLARTGRKQATATEDFDVHISYL